MGRWIELKIRIEEEAPGISGMDVEILDHYGDIDEEFLDMLWEDYDIEITNEQWQEYLKKKEADSASPSSSGGDSS